jgi:hypothetical protein
MQKEASSLAPALRAYRTTHACRGVTYLHTKHRYIHAKCAQAHTHTHIHTCRQTHSHTHTCKYTHIDTYACTIVQAAKHVDSPMLSRIMWAVATAGIRLPAVVQDTLMRRAGTRTSYCNLQDISNLMWAVAKIGLMHTCPCRVRVMCVCGWVAVLMHQAESKTFTAREYKACFLDTFSL